MEQKFQEIKARIEAGVALSRKEALDLYKTASLETLAELGQLVRQQKVPGHTITFLIDRNINYTNVCNSDCSFCGFYRHNPRDPEAYVLSREEIASKITEALELGATRILLQGGHNDELPYEYYTDLLTWISNNFKIEINAFSPSEIQQMCKISGKTNLEVLSELQACGLRGLPGGGAEILDDAVRQRVSPKKIRTAAWIEVMEVAHSLGLTTTATMVFGFGETIEQRINHFEVLRDAQTRSNAAGYEGFNAFYAWPLQHNENTSLGRSRLKDNYGATADEYLRNVAVSRIFLHNIPHHGASWPTMGLTVACQALGYGSDDFGSTMMEENVVSKAGSFSQSKWCLSPQEIQQHIKTAGFEPIQRDTSYNLLSQPILTQKVTVDQAEHSI